MSCLLRTQGREQQVAVDGVEVGHECGQVGCADDARAGGAVLQPAGEDHIFLFLVLSSAA